MSNKTTATNKAQAQAQANGEVMLGGIVSLAMYGKRNFVNGKSDKEDKYRLSLKVNQTTLGKLKETAEPFYKDVEKKWLPDWYKKDLSDFDGEDIFLNFASSYDFPVGEYVNGKLQPLGTFGDFLADNGNINGSKVVASITIKAGALYPKALVIKELHKQDISSIFGEDDEAFNEMLANDNPFED